MSQRQVDMNRNIQNSSALPGSATGPAPYRIVSFASLPSFRPVAGVNLDPTDHRPREPPISDEQSGAQQKSRHSIPTSPKTVSSVFAFQLEALLTCTPPRTLAFGWSADHSDRGFAAGPRLSLEIHEAPVLATHLISQTARQPRLQSRCTSTCFGRARQGFESVRRFKT